MRQIQVFLLLSFLVMVSCNKDKKPNVSVKTASGYVSADCYGYPGGQFTVQLIGDKTKYDLSSLYCEVAYDGTPTSHVVSTFDVTSSAAHAEKDFVNTLRTISGTERWYFGVKDKEGNVNVIQINITVP